MPIFDPESGVNAFITTLLSLLSMIACTPDDEGDGVDRNSRC